MNEDFGGVHLGVCVGGWSSCGACVEERCFSSAARDCVFPVCYPQHSRLCGVKLEHTGPLPRRRRLSIGLIHHGYSATTAQPSPGSTQTSLRPTSCWRKLWGHRWPVPSPQGAWKCVGNTVLQRAMDDWSHLAVDN